MPHHVVDVHTLTHTCSADPQPHVVDTWRSLVDTPAYGPCTNPCQVSSGRVTRLVDCRHVLPPGRHCSACTVTIIIRTVTTTHLGEELICTARVRDGLLPDPCPDCGLPVSAIFADTGRHILCHPPAGDR
jgi:hypothetical protein